MIIQEVIQLDEWWNQFCECPSWMMLSYWWMNWMNLESAAVKEFRSCHETFQLSGTRKLSGNAAAVRELCSCHETLLLSRNPSAVMEIFDCQRTPYSARELCTNQETLLLSVRSAVDRELWNSGQEPRQLCLVSSSFFNTSYVTRDSRPCWHCDNSPPTVEVVQYVTEGT
jgi:hypothetical protein